MLIAQADVQEMRGWVLSGGLIMAAVAGAWLLHYVLLTLARGFAKRSPLLGEKKVVSSMRWPTLLLVLTLAVRSILPGVPMPAEVEPALRHGLALSFIVAITWTLIAVITVGDDMFLRRYRVDVRDNLKARRMHTQVRVLSRTVAIIVALVGLAAALMTFEQIRQFGVSLLASAGIAGLVVGMAARPALSNIIAGIQIALTQPIRLDDVVIIDGEWGWIEEITTTYVVVKIWDQRRLIVPFSRIIETSFQNWTRTSADILGTVYLYCDYTVPIEEVRSEVRRIAGESPHWDGRVAGVQVTNATERGVELRALVSAADSPSAWDLRCEVREKLVTFMQERHPQALPRIRAELVPDGDRGGAGVDETGPSSPPDNPS